MNQAGERTEKPTPKRRQDARKRGQVAKSTDLTGALLVLAGAAAVPHLARSLVGTAGQAAARAGDAPASGLPKTIAWWAQMLVPGLAVPLVALAALAFCIVAAQVGLHSHSEGLKPRWERLNPLNGLKRLFSRHAVVEGLKASLKFAVLGSVTYALVAQEWPAIAGTGGLGPGATAEASIGAIQTLATRFGLAWLAIGVLDYFFQRHQLERQLMMTRDELKREMREQDGSPEVKSAQHQRRRKLAKGGMATRLKEADVLVTNPTHFAVAIRYDQSTMPAPVVVAKGQDYLALRMREIAEDVGLPRVEDKPLAQALYRQCEAGDPIPRDLFLPVAEVLAYVYKTLRRAKK